VCVCEPSNPISRCAYPLPVRTCDNIYGRRLSLGKVLIDYAACTTMTWRATLNLLPRQSLIRNARQTAAAVFRKENIIFASRKRIDFRGTTRVHYSTWLCSDLCSTVRGWTRTERFCTPYVSNCIQYQNICLCKPVHRPHVVIRSGFTWIISYSIRFSV